MTISPSPTSLTVATPGHQGDPLPGSPTTPGSAESSRAGTPGVSPGGSRPLKILLISHAFSPRVGGIEEMSRLLATGFAQAGHLVRVATQTPGPGHLQFPFEVIRRPGARALWALFSWCDLVVHSNITLHGLWPLLFHRKPWVVIHHTWIFHPVGKTHFAQLFKMAVLPAAHSIAVSRALARSLPVPSVVIPNCYDKSVFQNSEGTPRDRDLLFVGRLVTDKGADVLLHALRRLRDRGLRPSLTIAGSGPDEAAVRALATRLGLEEQITFTGLRRTPEVAALMQRHQLLVIPSRWREPFGIVALEGIASGCYVIGSAGGGLTEAIGSCGRTVANGSAAELTDALASALQNRPSTPAAVVRRHLARHSPAQVVSRYLSCLTALHADVVRPSL